MNLFIMMMGVIRSAETSALTTSTLRHITKDSIFLKSPL
jgi:hypothetical protein